MFIVKCDKCDHQADVGTTQTLPPSWLTIRLSTSGAAIRDYQCPSKTLCSNCIEKLGIAKTPDEEKQPELLDKLWDIMVELVEEARENI